MPFGNFSTVNRKRRLQLSYRRIEFARAARCCSKRDRFRDPNNDKLTHLVGELCTRSDEFRTRWGAHNVRFHRTGRKHMHHPAVGELDLAYEGLELPADPELTLYILTAAPASPTAERLQLLASWAASEKSSSTTVR